MSRINLSVFDQHMHHAGLSTRGPVCEATIVIVEDEPLWSDAIEVLCSFLEVRLSRISSDIDLAPGTCVISAPWPCWPTWKLLVRTERM